MSLTVIYLYLICLKKQRLSAKYNENELEMVFKSILARVTFQNNTQRKINANAFTRCDNKFYIKRIKEICKILLCLQILIQILSLPPKIKSFN